MYDVPAVLDHPELLVPLRRSVLEGARVAYLRSAKIKLTPRCNLCCRACRYGRGRTAPELDTAHWCAVITDLARLGCRKLHLSGGEVLLRPDLEAIIAHAVEHKVKVALTSNLTLLTRERARCLLAAGPSSLSTSLDGASSRVHDAIRGQKGSFQRTLRALERLRAHARGGGPRLRVNFVLMRENFRDYPALIDLAADHGAEEVVPMPVDSKRPELRLSKRLLTEYELEVAPRVHERRAARGMSLATAAVHPFGRGVTALRESAEGRYAGGYYRTALCYSPWLHLFVAWDGKVYPCCMTNGRMPPLGDLSTDDPIRVFRGAAFQKLRAVMLQERLPACHSCDMLLRENAELARALGTCAPAAQAQASRRDTNAPASSA